MTADDRKQRLRRLDQIFVRTPIYFVTTCTNNRRAILAKQSVHQAFVRFAEKGAQRGAWVGTYVLMPDHLHALTDSALKPSKILQYINGIISRRVIDHLKEHGHNASLRKLKRESGARGHQYSLWAHHSNAFPVFSEDMFMQKVNYIHQNPVRAAMVERAEDYHWSSVRIWKRCPLEDEPLMVNIEQLKWRQR